MVHALVAFARAANSHIPPIFAFHDNFLTSALGIKQTPPHNPAQLPFFIRQQSAQ